MQDLFFLPAIWVLKGAESNTLNLPTLTVDLVAPKEGLLFFAN
jgi:hypothetical protein